MPCKISGKMKLATTVLWWLFSYAESKEEAPREAGREINYLRVVEIH